MADGGRISEPIGSVPSVIEWSKTLRSRSPSPTRIRSRSPSPSALNSARSGGYLTDVRSSTSNMKKSESNMLRKSTGNLSSRLAMSGMFMPLKGKKLSTKSPRHSKSVGFSTRYYDTTTSFKSSMSKLNKTSSSVNSPDLNNIEGEYIKNLQQQIYFLELESNYLRDQAKKATEMHPKMTNEAERMLAKLRVMQTEMDGMQLEMRKKDSEVSVVNVEKDKILERLQDEEAARSRDKRMLMDEVIQLKKEKDAFERDIGHKDYQLAEARTELDKSATALKNADLKLQTLRTQLEQREEQQRLVQISLEEKRTELISAETQLRELEDKYYNSTVTVQDKIVDELREEIRALRQKLKETEMAADHDRYMKDKMGDDNSHLVKENAILNQQITELQKQIERERSIRDVNDSRHSQNIAELVQLKDREKDSRLELNHTKEQLQKEQDKTYSFMEQISKLDSVSKSQELHLNTSKSRIAELEGYQVTLEADNAQLRKDKMLLVDHVSEVQRKLDMKEQELIMLRGQLTTTESKVRDIQHIKSMESTVQSQKWEEFEKLAESMRSLSHSMAQTGPGTSSSTRVLQY